MVVLKHRRKAFQPAGGGNLMDGIGGTHHAVFSHYQRYAASTEYGVVREDGGNTDATIGWSSGKVDTSAITTHKGANGVWLQEWRNQVTGKDDAIQTAVDSRQPQLILDGGTGIYFPFYDPAVFTNLQTVTAYTMAAELDYYCVARVDSGAGTPQKNIFAGKSTSLQFGHTVSTTLVSLKNPQSYATMGTWTSLGLVQVTFRASATAAECLIRKNGSALSMTAQAAITNVQAGLTIGAAQGAGTSFNWDGEILEVIVTSQLSDADRDTIEAQLISDYGL